MTDDKRKTNISPNDMQMVCMSPHEGNAIMLIPPAPLAVVVVIIIMIMIIIILNILISVWRLSLGVQRNGCGSGGEGSRRRDWSVRS